MSQPLSRCPSTSQKNCDLLTSLAQGHSQLCSNLGLSDAAAIRSATAVGMVIALWRNGPVEDMHAGRRGPSDAAMFAESTVLHTHALEVIEADEPNFALIDFERILLDRKRTWAGTGGRTLRDLGYGHLGAYDRHVRNRVDTLHALSDHTCVDSPWEIYLTRRAATYGRDHLGMPNWPVIVDRITTLIANPSHRAWKIGDADTLTMSEAPASTPPAEELAILLLESPSHLPGEVLEWLSENFLFCAGPPHSPQWRKS